MGEVLRERGLHAPVRAWADIEGKLIAAVTEHNDRSAQWAPQPIEDAPSMLVEATQEDSSGPTMHVAVRAERVACLTSGKSSGR